MVLTTSRRKITQLAVEDGKAPHYERQTVLLIGIGATLGKVGIVDHRCSSNQQINAITFMKDFNAYFGA